MQFGFLGISYQNARLEIRDRISFTDAMKLDFYQKAEAAGVQQCMVLSTCNRSEIYYIYIEEKQKAKLRQIYEEMFPDVEVRPYLSELSGNAAMAYLFRTAAGLESLVLGEDQILGQVKEALEDSRAMGYSGKELNRIVRDAVTCAKQIKTELRISERPLSVSYIGIRMLEEACGLAGKRILVIGSGKAAVLALKYLCVPKPMQVAACSRNDAHARRLREDFPQLRIISYGERYEALKTCDIVVSATASPHLVLRRKDFCPERPLTMLDLAAPRDIDTAFAEEPLVRLINLDTLQEIAADNQRDRELLAERSRERIEAAVQETAAWLLQSRMDPTIECLQQRCGEIAEDSYAYLTRKLELSQREKKILKKVLSASLQRLLREPIRELKRLDTEEEQEEYMRLVRQLFQL